MYDLKKFISVSCLSLILLGFFFLLGNGEVFLAFYIHLKELMFVHILNKNLLSFYPIYTQILLRRNSSETLFLIWQTIFRLACCIFNLHNFLDSKVNFKFCYTYNYSDKNVHSYMGDGFGYQDRFS